MATKKVKMLVGFSGEVSWPANSIQDLESAEADRLIERGLAEIVETVKKTTKKKATRKATETASVN